MAEIGLTLTLPGAICALKRTVDAVICMYKAHNQCDENRAAMNKLEHILHLIGPALTSMQEGAASLKSSCQPALEYVRGVVLDQNRVLDEALRSNRFWRLWHVYESEALLNDVLEALTKAFIVGLPTATLQILIEQEALRQGADSELRRQLNELDAKQGAAMANSQACMQRLDQLNSSLSKLAAASLHGDTLALRRTAQEAIATDYAKDMDIVLRQFDEAMAEHAAALAAVAPEFEDPITRDIMVDPVKCSDGVTYCRFSAFNIMDNKSHMPGCKSGLFSIVVDDITVRRQLFAALPHQEARFNEKRQHYVASVAAAEATGNYVTALLRARRALQFLPDDHDAVLGLQASVRRYEALATRLAAEPPANPQVLLRLAAAAGQGNTAVVQQLLDARVAADSRLPDGSTPLYLAARAGHVDIVTQLLQAKVAASIASDAGWTPLHAAAYGGHIDIVVQLLDAGADSAAGIDNGGWTALHIAARHGYAQMASRLLEAHAPANASLASTAATPLHIAAEHGHVDVANWLIAAGANVNALDMRRQTPLHRAAAQGRDAVVASLLDTTGPRASGRDADGMSPLHLAASGGHIAAVRALVAGGADLRQKVWSCCMRHDAAGLAKRSGHNLVASYLRIAVGGACRTK